MAVTFEGKLVVAISSRALFDFEDENRVFEASGESPYIALQFSRLDVPAKEGVAFTLVKKLLAFNTPEASRVEVVILSKNDPVSGLRVFRSAEKAGLRLERGVFTRGRSPYRYLDALKANLFLSANEHDVMSALEARFPAARVVPESAQAAGRHAGEVRIAFDGDAVLFSDEAERVYQRDGLDAFTRHETVHALRPLPPSSRAPAAYACAGDIAEQDVAINREIGRHGLSVIEKIATSKRPGEPVNVLTHCNAGWLATVDWGTATSPIYQAHDRGIPVHIWVDETRPRNQGASLTAWELGHHGVPHTVIADNTGGHLMQHGMVDLVIVGTDRVAANGDVCNKIGTYLKALAARDNGVPFYVALPSPTIDFHVNDGIAEIPIEQREPSEVTEMTGRTRDGRIETVRVVPDNSPAANYAFDVTPARLVSGLITERGLVRAERAALASAFPERAVG